MKRLRRWLNGFDRCRVGGHRMGTRSGYSLCRKHGGWITDPSLED